VGHLQNKFDRASLTYEEHSQVQKEMANVLVSLLPADFSPFSILELACGTGHLTAQLRTHYPSAGFVATDASSAMLEKARSKFPADASMAFERLDVLEGLGGRKADLIASAALVQWLPDLEAHFRAVAAALPDGGLYAVSAFCRSNFPELNAILAAPPFEYHDFPGHRLEDATTTAERAGFEIVGSIQHSATVPYGSARAFLAMLKATGAVRAPERPPSRTRATYLLRELERTAAREAGRPGIVATWRPWYLILRKNALSKAMTVR
jgi:malonyl-ACP O-methyltransferase BioC